VTMWRHREMENVLGGAIGKSMTVDQLRQLVDEFISESEFVDFKSKRALLPGARQPQQVALRMR
jgi:hypothetical protein